MPINQPPIKEEAAESSWDLEVTQTINRLEQQLDALTAGTGIGNASAPETYAFYA